MRAPLHLDISSKWSNIDPFLRSPTIADPNTIPSLALSGSTDPEAPVRFEPKPPLPDRLTLLALVVFIFMLGSGPLITRYTFSQLAPFWSGCLRFGGAGLAFWGVVWLRRLPVPRGKALVGALLFGFLNIGLSLTFILWALEKTPASVYSITIAVIPLLTLLLAAAHRVERLRLRGVVGGVLAVAGITVIMSSSLETGTPLILSRMVSIVLGAICTAEAGVVIQLFPKSHPIAANALGMSLSSAMLLIVSLLAGEPRLLPSEPTVWLALGWLTLAGGIFGFTLNLFLLQRWTASGVSYAFVLSPILTTILGATLAGEQITWSFILGGLLVLFGVWAGALSGSKN